MKSTSDYQIIGVIDTTTQEVLETNPETDRENVITDLKLISIIVFLEETKEEAFSKITSMTLWKNLERG